MRVREFKLLALVILLGIDVVIFTAPAFTEPGATLPGPFGVKLLILLGPDGPAPGGALPETVAASRILALIFLAMGLVAGLAEWPAEVRLGDLGVKLCVAAAGPVV